MQTRIGLELALAREFQHREIERQARERRMPSAPRSSIRRTVGRRVIAFGQRIAAEPSLELARTR
jgi:hypothetical protein